MRFLFYTIFLFFTSSVLAQQTLVPIFSEPQKVGGTINSSSEEVMPYISADGKTMYFSRVFHSANIGGSKAGQDIWYASGNAEKGSWGAPQHPQAPLNTKGNNAVVGVADGGNRLYLLNKYGRKGSTSFGLSMSEFQDGQWTEPKEVEIPGLDKLADFYSFWMNPEGDTLLISMQNENTSKEDLFVCFYKNGKWSEPKSLGTSVNSFGNDFSPFLSEDGKSLYFATDGRGGRGSADIFVCQRKDDTWTNWTLPKNLGKEINSREFDAYFYMYKDRIYFASNRGGGFSDIYTATVIAKTKEEIDAIVNKVPDPKSIYYKESVFILFDKEKSILDEVANELSKDQELKIVISGYTCDIGSETSNEELSLRRANAVQTYLMLKGIAQSRMKIEHFGETKTKESGLMAKDKALQRRVDIEFVREF